MSQEDEVFKAFTPVKNRADRLSQRGQLEEALRLLHEFRDAWRPRGGAYLEGLIALWEGRFRRSQVRGPGVYEPIAPPQEALAEAEPRASGLFYTLHAAGQLNKLTYRENGQDVEWLVLRAGKAAGRRENQSEVQEFLESGQVEEYSGRFEHGPYWPGLTFGEWARQAVEQVREAARTGRGVDFIRGHLL